MKLIIQIPAYNEEQTLPAALRALPRRLRGVSSVEVLVVDDGSSDATAKAAKASGADCVVSLPAHRGLAAAFAAGLEESLRRGADIVVNTDADNQYSAEDIPALIEPILSGKAALAVGDRGVAGLKWFSPGKRLLQRLGSALIGWASGLRTPDAASGFRAFSRDAALRTLVMSRYSYTLETLIQAGARGEAVAFVPVRTNPPARPSRLAAGTLHYLLFSGATLLRSFVMYRPLRVFSILGSLFLLAGLALSVRYLYFAASGFGAGHVQSVILAAVLLIVGVMVFCIGLVADLIGFNRRILEEELFRTRKMELERKLKRSPKSPPPPRPPPGRPNGGGAGGGECKDFSCSPSSSPALPSRAGREITAGPSSGKAAARWPRSESGCGSSRRMPRAPRRTRNKAAWRFSVRVIWFRIGGSCCWIRPAGCRCCGSAAGSAA
jgi:glycosyltransferase involved in cell wall biosynthesis